MPKLREPENRVQDPAELKIEYILRSRIHLWKDNPRKNDKAAVELAALIRQNGLRSPVNVWRKNMTAYKGNTTLKALDLINGKNDYQVPVIFHYFPSEAAAKAYGLSDNKASEFAEWDEDLLAQMMSSKTMEPLLGTTGFKEKEISSILWIPDKDRLNREETDSGMLGKLQLFCRPEDKEEITNLLRDWAESSGFQDIIIK